ncbi:TAXI family TRAP transporter solute-binding subunit [Bacillus sp. Marseille-P3661]|uniref:TAXI family TRAP transporter solute-binding subunit n=1 Tax=Bacillus sp. Marseille-P3661 TaxID=1936234 RepID=UPI000C8598EB|nr:TAXI family TRAP transporter solute-binding subunit [Bacillus sp. Marseille-P3661]
MKKNYKTKNHMFLIGIVMLMSLVLFGCGNGNENASTAEGSENSGNGESESDTVQLSAAIAGQTSAPYIYTGALAEILRKEGNIDLEVFPYSGGIGNVQLIENGEADFGIMFNVSQNWAYNGIVAYDKPYKDIRALVGTNYKSFVGIVARNEFLEEHNIKSLADIKEKEIPVKIITKPEGTLAEYITRLVLEAYDLDYKTIESYGGNVQLAADEVVLSTFQNNTSDIFILALPRNQATLTELSTQNDVTILSMEDDKRAYLSENYGFVKDDVLEAGNYEGQDEDVITNSLGLTYITHARMDDDVAYELAKAFVENKEALVEAHAAFAEFDPKTAGHADSNGHIPLHPGAERYYKEIGALD